jgi:hypothetical protein
MSGYLEGDNVPVPANVIRANIRAIVGTAEEMVHTLHFVRVNTTTTNQPSLQDIAAKIVEEWTEYLTTINGTPTFEPRVWLRPDVAYQTVDVYALNAAGLATEQAQALFGSTAVGTGSSVANAPEIAVVASLKTGLPGRSKRGRLYLGGFTVGAVAAGGVVSANATPGMSRGLAKFGQDMKMQDTALVDRLNWVVLSRTTTSVQKITEVRIGNLFDVQRRRQNGLSETFFNSPITY